MSTDGTPELKLVIERISKNAALGTSAAVESSGELRGYLRISRREALVLRDISIYFEGGFSKAQGIKTKSLYRSIKKLDFTKIIGSVVHPDIQGGTQSIGRHPFTVQAHANTYPKVPQPSSEYPANRSNSILFSR